MNYKMYYSDDAKVKGKNDRPALLAITTIAPMIAVEKA